VDICCLTCVMPKGARAEILKNFEVRICSGGPGNSNKNYLSNSKRLTHFIELAS
jgi:hypothetical protein